MAVFAFFRLFALGVGAGNKDEQKQTVDFD
jgi:hypothetical protein